jgi:UDP-N-acetylmuramate dehydrogenase
MISSGRLDQLETRFAGRLHFNQPLEKYSSARIGGSADVLLMAHSAAELAEIISELWQLHLPYVILGGGSNMLISDAGVREVVILNKSRKIIFDLDTPSVWAESGYNFGALARQAGRKGLAGLEWAAGIPGTVGGAVVGNAGAHGGDTASSLILAEVLHRTQGRHEWSSDDIKFEYRTSRFKQQPEEVVVLAASFKLEHGKASEIKEKLEEFLAFRRRTQPPGASMGSMFKNPPEDHAGRLIDAAGLKGAQIGEAQISELHANFFINHGGASAADVYSLIRLAQKAVKEKFGVQLELEIGLVGEWK